ncbi:MAG: metal-sulfur cluster assembly factor [Chloroflexi bacterium]|nr:metal-sulfur cluster assembly factor [Chloroflexota bacterium]
MVTKDQVMAALRGVEDPELGLNVVDLGLIYNVDIVNDNVKVEMTLTTPGCPLHDSIGRGAQAAVAKVPGVKTAEVRLVWDPPWSPSRMSDAAKKALGWG